MNDYLLPVIVFILIFLVFLVFGFYKIRRILNKWKCQAISCSKQVSTITASDVINQSINQITNQVINQINNQGVTGEEIQINKTTLEVEEICAPPEFDVHFNGTTQGANNTTICELGLVRNIRSGNFIRHLLTSHNDADSSTLTSHPDDLIWFSALNPFTGNPDEHQFNVDTGRGDRGQWVLNGNVLQIFFAIAPTRWFSNESLPNNKGFVGERHTLKPGLYIRLPQCMRFTDANPTGAVGGTLSFDFRYRGVGSVSIQSPPQGFFNDAEGATGESFGSVLRTGTQCFMPLDIKTIIRPPATTGTFPAPAYNDSLNVNHLRYARLDLHNYSDIAWITSDGDSTYNPDGDPVSKPGWSDGPSLPFQGATGPEDSIYQTTRFEFVVSLMVESI